MLTAPAGTVRAGTGAVTGPASAVAAGPAGYSGGGREGGYSGGGREGGYSGGNREGGYSGGSGGGRDGGYRGGDRSGGFRGGDRQGGTGGGSREGGYSSGRREGGFGGAGREGGFGGTSREGGPSGGREGGFSGGSREGGSSGGRSGGYSSGGSRPGGYGGGNRDSGFRGGDRTSGGYRGGDREGGFRGGDRDAGRTGGREGGYQGRDRDASPRGDAGTREGGGYTGGTREGGFRGGDRAGGFRGGDRDRGADRGGREGGFRGGDRPGGYRGGDRDSAGSGGYRGGDRDGGFRGDRGAGSRDGYRGGDRSGGYSQDRAGVEPSSVEPSDAPIVAADSAGQDWSAGDRYESRGRGGREDEPEIPEEIQASDLDRGVREELVTLARAVNERVARHLVAAGTLVDEDPELALAHAVAARRLASRIAVVREAVGIAAYHAGEWTTALAELRTYHRMTGKQSHLAVLADCERALGRPEKAVDIYRTADRASLDPSEAVELLIVAAGARRDLGQAEAAVAMLQVRELGLDAPYAARLRYAYADGLLSLDRRDEAREWFSRAVDADEDGSTDAAERLLELDGITLEGDDQPEDDEFPADADADADSRR